MFGVDSMIFEPKACWARKATSMNQFVRENAESFVFRTFDALIEKKVISTNPRMGQHRAIQLDPRKLSLGENLAKPPGPSFCPRSRLCY
jgi:hypothetical protein